jgi:hypothetical protein
MTWLQWMDDNWMYIIIALIIVALTFICVGHIYRDAIQLAMKKDFIKLPATTVDWWSISHMALFALFGFIKPGYPLAAFLVGAGFEVFEDYLSSDATTQIVDCSVTHDEEGVRKFFCSGINTDYWYAKWDDVLWNILGYIVGQSIRYQVDS